MPPNHMRMGFENAVAVYSFLPVESAARNPMFSYLCIRVRLSNKYIMIGSGKITNTRRAIHGVDIVAGKEESVAIEKLRFILKLY